MAAVTIAEFDALLAAELPLATAWNFQTEAIGDGTARMRLPYSDQLLRPGGTVVGPAMMALADVALYAAVIGAIGLEPLAVTTSLTTNFLRKPPPGDLIADCRMIKVGRRLAYGEVSIYREGDPDPVCHVTGTYSIPPDRQVG